jgi:transcriptional regulator with XRE-family HTH domain
MANDDTDCGFGAQLKRAREAQDMSLTDAAARAGLAASTVCSLEQMQEPPWRSEAAKSYARVLGFELARQFSWSLRPRDDESSPDASADAA